MFRTRKDMGQPLDVEAGACQRRAAARDQLPCQADSGGDRDLLTEHGPNRELEPVPRTWYAQPWFLRHQRGEDGIGGKLRVHGVRVGGEIEHAPHARNDRRQRRQPWESHGHSQRVPGGGLHYDNAVHPGDLDRARIAIVRDHLDARDGTSPEERDHRGPIVWGPIAQADGDFTVLSGRYAGGGGAPQRTWRTVEEPLEDFVEASDAAES